MSIQSIYLRVMYQGKPILKKIKQINYNNPSLNSQGMKGVFFQTKAPLLIRDELRYNPGFKDSLQQTVEQEEFKRRRMSNTPKEAYEEKPVPVPTYQPQMRYNKREVVGKVTEKPLDQDFSAYNYRGFQNIKTKQVHGFDIIKNF